MWIMFLGLNPFPPVFLSKFVTHWTKVVETARKFILYTTGMLKVLVKGNSVRLIGYVHDLKLMVNKLAEMCINF